LLIIASAQELSARRTPIRLGAFFAIYGVAPIAAERPRQQRRPGERP